MEALDIAHLHRETYIAVMNSALRHHGDKRALAEALGIRVQHLSNLLNSGESGDTYVRTPGPRLAERIADLLPLDKEVREDLKSHIYLAWLAEREALGYLFHSRRARYRALTRFMLADLLTAIGNFHFVASRTADPQEARHKYRVLRRACKLALARIDPDPEKVNNSHEDFDANPLEFVQLCLFLHDVQCVLNRADDALVHAKYATQIMEACEPTDFYMRKDYFEHLKVNTVVAECLAYRNLNLTGQALRESYKAEALVKEIGTYAAGYWLPHALENRLKALVSTPRFTLGEVLSLSKQAEAAFSQRPDNFESRWQLSLKEAEARAYMEYGVQNESERSLRQAAGLLQDVVENVDKVPQLGPVTKTRLLRTYARVHWKLGHRDEWLHFMRVALDTALHAGLTHQVEQAKDEYGQELSPILHGLGQGEVEA